MGRVTASDASRIFTSDFSLRTGDMPKTYIYEKLAEVRLGEPIAQFYSHQTEEGQIAEDEARKWFAFSSDHKITNAGFIVHDDGRCGCSPDALLDDEGGLEIKCCQPTNHVRYLLEGKVPTEYNPQVQFSLYVTGRKWWKFVSYRRRFPALVVTVERDEEICAKIATGLEAFYKMYDAALAKLKAL